MNKMMKFKVTYQKYFNKVRWLCQESKLENIMVRLEFYTSSQGRRF